ncbi:NAD(P)-binding protein [Auriculariales sp. MPI-PUGE-AT-0066]|nr:NAD(P)-binding protein [Auriculariales sp. MPI-PUGE-AT-0066]
MASPLFSLKGKTVLITGCTRGIGASSALALAQAGASSIVLVQRDRSNLATHDAIVKLGLGTRVHVLEADLADLEAVRRIFGRACECAGIQRRYPSAEFPESEWDESLAPLPSRRQTHDLHQSRRQNHQFRLLLTFQGGLTVPAYAAAKGAVGQFTKSLSNEWASKGVQVNAICPGYVETDMNEKLLADPTRLRQISERIPAGRWGTPEDFAGPVVFLASKASDYVSGELLVVDGGWMGR